MSGEQDRRLGLPEPRHRDQDPRGGHVRHPQAVQQGRDLRDSPGVPGRSSDNTGERRGLINGDVIRTHD